MTGPMELAASAPRFTTATFDDAVAEHYAPLVRRLALVVGDRDEAEDLAQAAYLRAFQAWSRFDGRDVRGWLFTIGLRLAFNERRRRLRALRGLVVQGPPAWAPETDADLWQALGAIDRRHRAALLLHTLDGYTHDEIGRMLGVPPGTIGSWISRARARLRAVLTEEDR